MTKKQIKTLEKKLINIQKKYVAEKKGYIEYNQSSKPDFLYIWFSILEKLNFKKKTDVLEVGCGNGIFLLFFKEMKFTNLSGVDIELDNSEFDKETYDKNFGNNNGKIRLDVCNVDIQNLPHETNSKSIVILNQVLEHLHNPEKAIIEINRVLQKDGIVLVGTPNVANLKNRISLLLGKSNYYIFDQFLKVRTDDGLFVGHVREYTIDEVKTLFRKNGFKIIHSEYIPSDYKTSYPKSKLIYKIYYTIEKIFPQVRYQMCIIAQKIN